MELIISIGILSIIMIFLYESYSALNKSNSFYEEKADNIRYEQLRKKVLFLDFSLALSESIKILNQNKNEDIVFLQSTNSIHNRYNPYIAYIFNNSKLYRLESLKEFEKYPLSSDSDFSFEYFGEAKSFRVYESSKDIKKQLLVHVDFEKDTDILMKIKILE